MALSEGLKGFVNFFTKSFNEGGEDDAFMDLVDGDDGLSPLFAEIHTNQAKLL